MPEDLETGRSVQHQFDQKLGAWVAAQGEVTDLDTTHAEENTTVWGFHIGDAVVQLQITRFPVSGK